MKKSNLVEEFEQFMTGAEATPPARATHSLRDLVHRDLNPSEKRIFGKLGLIHLFVGGFTLLFCPQFNLNLMGNDGLMGIFMQYGEVACMLGCGAVFLGGTALVTALILSPEEMKALRRHRIGFLTLIASLSVGAFICFGFATLDVMALVWLLGSVLGGLITLELGWKLRKQLT